VRKILDTTNHDGAAKDHAPVLTGVTSTSTADAMAQTESYQTLGAEGILADVVGMRFPGISSPLFEPDKAPRAPNTPKDGYGVKDDGRLYKRASIIIRLPVASCW